MPPSTLFFEHLARTFLSGLLYLVSRLLVHVFDQHVTRHGRRSITWARMRSDPARHGPALSFKLPTPVRRSVPDQDQIGST